MDIVIDETNFLNIGSYLSVAERATVPALPECAFQTNITHATQALKLCKRLANLGIRIVDNYWQVEGMVFVFADESDLTLFSVAYEKVQNAN